MASSGKSEDTFEEIEETQRALRESIEQSIEQSMDLAARSEQLIRKHREEAKEADWRTGPAGDRLSLPRSRPERVGTCLEVQKPVPVTYRGVVIRDAFGVDLLVKQRLVIEVKSVERLAPIHAKQLLTYLRLMDQPLGLLMNFGADMFRNGLKRVINKRSSYAAPRVR